MNTVHHITDPAAPASATDWRRQPLLCSRDLSKVLHTLVEKVKKAPRELTMADCEGLECSLHLCLLELAVWHQDFCHEHVKNRSRMRFADMEEAFRLLYGDGQAFGLLPPVRSSVHEFLKMFADHTLRFEWMESHGLWTGDGWCPLVERLVGVATDYEQLWHYREHLVFHLYAGGLDRALAMQALLANPCAYPRLVEGLYRHRAEAGSLYPVAEVERLHSLLMHQQQSAHEALCAWWDEHQMSQWTVFVRLCVENHFLTEVSQEERMGNSSVTHCIEADMQRNFCLLLLDYRDSLKYSLKSDGLALSGNKADIDDNQLLRLMSFTIMPIISASVFSRAKNDYVKKHQRARLASSASHLSLAAPSSDTESAAGPRPLLSILPTVPVPLCGTLPPPLAA